MLGGSVREAYFLMDKVCFCFLHPESGTAGRYVAWPKDKSFIPIVRHIWGEWPDGGMHTFSFLLLNVSTSTRSFNRVPSNSELSTHIMVSSISDVYV